MGFDQAQLEAVIGAVAAKPEVGRTVWKARSTWQHGFRSEGESFSIADSNEVWILEMVGKGPGGKGGDSPFAEITDEDIERLKELAKKKP